MLGLTLAALHFACASDSNSSNGSSFFGNSDNKGNSCLNNGSSHSSQIFDNKEDHSSSNGNPSWNCPGNQDQTCGPNHETNPNNPDGDNGRRTGHCGGSNGQGHKHHGNGHGYGHHGGGCKPPNVPEPISSVLFCLGAATLGFRQYRKSKALSE